ncbi:MAG: endonuclease/exonuclease/phosphatase family protein [Tannerella sp.]|nr:endonuclease/exonuclease/phosphatase family protein [Tannerella sp.]
MRAKSKKKTAWMRPFGLMFNSILGSLSILMLILLVASAYSDYVSPERFIIFAYLGLAFPILIILNTCLFIFWLLAKKWRLILIFGLVFVACWKPLDRYCPFYPVTPIAEDNNVIKVLSYNVMCFAYQGHSNASPNKIIEYIAESGADIVCLQEYMTGTHSNMMSSAEIAKALPMYPYISETIFTPAANKSNKYGLAVLSKFPITSSRRINYESAYNGSAIYIINVREKKLVVVNNHLESFKLTAEDRLKYSDIIKNANFDFFEELGGQIQQKLGQAFRIRARQAQTVAREIQKENGYYTIVCGDFNDTPISYACRTVRGQLIDAYAKSGLGPGISYNRNFFMFRIDHIFYSPTMEAFNCRIDRSIKVSDHYPIKCDLRLN